MSEAISKVNVSDAASCQLTKQRALIDKIRPKGFFTLQVLRNGQVIHTEVFDNTAVNEGRNKMLDVMFGAVAAITSWFIGLMDNTAFSANPVTDTASSHAGWTEFTAFTETTRQAWGVGAASSQQITNASPAVFNINATGTIRGILVISNNTKGGTTGTLWATALFASSVAVANTDQIKITYTVQI